MRCDFCVFKTRQSHEHSFIKPLKSEAIHETSLSGKCISFFFFLLKYLHFFVPVLHHVNRRASKYHRVQEEDPVARLSAHLFLQLHVLS